MRARGGARVLDRVVLAGRATYLGGGLTLYEKDGDACSVIGRGTGMAREGVRAMIEWMVPQHGRSLGPLMLGGILGVGYMEGLGGGQEGCDSG
jgi:hypothetical protein